MMPRQSAGIRSSLSLYSQDKRGYQPYSPFCVGILNLSLWGPAIPSISGRVPHTHVHLKLPVLVNIIPPLLSDMRAQCWWHLICLRRYYHLVTTPGAPRYTETVTLSKYATNAGADTPGHMSHILLPEYSKCKFNSCLTKRPDWSISNIR